MNRGFRILVVAVLLCIISSAAYVSYKVFFSNPTRSIPLLKGSSVVEAVQTLERMGIKARIEQEDSSLPRGTVIGQWPETGVNLRADKPAILKVSRGSEKNTLPDLRGQTQEQAVSRLQENGFVVGEIQKINHERPAGVVIAQTPAAPASVSPGRSVGLLVSLGPAVASGVVIVPDLLERDEKTAVQLARESSLRPLVEYVFDQNSPQGMVVSMNPSAGRRASRGAAVTLRVASWDRALDTRKTAPASSGERTSGGTRVTVVTPGAEAQNTAAPSNSGAQQPTNTAAAPARPEAPNPPASSSGRQKTAQIRYQAPPVKDQQLRIEMIDKNGERVLLDRKATAGEYVSLNVTYVGEAVVTIYLGGNFVWQDRYR